MARICPNCGRPAIDEQSQFCNKCGTPFPDDQPKKVVVRTMPRMAETPQAPPEPPVPPVQTYAEPPAAPAAAPLRPKARAPAKKAPARAMNPESPALPFKKLIARDFIRPMYWLGVLCILVVVFSAISADLAKTGTGTGSGTEPESDASSGDFLSAIPFFWIGVMVFANLFWRVLCETSAVVFAQNAVPAAANDVRGGEQEWLSDEEILGYSGGATDEMVSCPRCGKIVPAEDLETCDECGIPGCRSCVRKMGLLKSKWTCKDCFTKK